MQHFRNLWPPPPPARPDTPLPPLHAVAPRNHIIPSESDDHGDGEQCDRYHPSIATHAHRFTMSADALTDALSKLRSLVNSKLDNQKAPAQLLVAVEQSLTEAKVQAAPQASTSATVDDDGASNTRRPAEYFLALEAMLERATAKEAPPTLLPSTFYILSLVAPHVSPAIIRARLSSLLPAIYFVLSNPHPSATAAAESHSALLRSAIAILQAVLQHVGRDRALLQSETQLRSSWDATLELCADSRPKVRRRAQEAVGSILSGSTDGLAGSADLVSDHAWSSAKPHPYASRTAEWCARTLASVSQSGGVQSNKGKSKGKSPAYDVKTGRAQGAQEAAKQRQADVTGGASVGIWVCGFLKNIVSVLPEKHIAQLCEELLRLPGLQNPFLTVSTFEVFEALYRPPKVAPAVSNLQGSGGALAAASAAAAAAASASATQPAPSSLVQTLQALRSSTLRPSTSDVQLLPPYLRALEGAVVALARYDGGNQAWSLFPDVWDDVFDLSLSARSDASRKSLAVRTAGQETLCSFIRYCIPESAIRQALNAGDASTTTLGKMIASLDMALSGQALRYTHSRAEIFSILAALMSKLRIRVSSTKPVEGAAPASAATQLLMPLIKTVAELRQTPRFEHRERADLVLGAATEACGPEVIFAELPLGLLGEDGPGKQGRAWLLPLMKGKITNAPLSHFVREIVPLSEKLFNARAEAESSTGRGVEAKMYEALVEQLWALFPGYCDLPVDLPQGLTQQFAELLANVLYTQQALRPSILRGLTLLVERNEALSRSGAPDEILLLSFGLTAAAGKSNLEHLVQLAPAFLSVFSNLLSQSPSSSRGYITEVIGAFMRILPPTEVTSTFEKIRGMLDSSLQELVPQRDREVGPHAVPPVAHSMLDLLITIVPFLATGDAVVLFELASSDKLLKNDDAGVQKKTYRILARLMDGRKGEAVLLSGAGTARNVAQLLARLRDATVSVASGAKRDRLNLLSAIVPRIPPTELHLLPSVIPEAVLATKEANQGSRETAYQLLVEMGNKMQSGGSIKQGLLDADDDTAAAAAVADSGEGDRAASLTEYLTMVGAGLAGTSPHMISASITSFSRLLYEFKDELPQETIEEVMSTIEVFLSSPNREIVKSVLGFVKVAIVSLDFDMVNGHLPTFVPAMLKWSPEHRAHFKSKVRHIFERLLRRFGYDRLISLTDEDNRKLVVNIKKRKDRAKRKKLAKEDDGQGEDDEIGGAPGAKAPRKDLGVDAFEEALYGSESDLSDSDDDGDEADVANLARKAAGARQIKGKAGAQAANGPQKPRRKRGEGREEEAYLLEDDEDIPMNLLDRSAGASGHIATRAVGNASSAKRRQPGQEAGQFKLDEQTGRMVIDDPDATPSTGAATSAANHNSSDFSGAGAYLERETGIDGHTHSGRGGAVRFNKNNKRTRAAEAELEQMEVEAENAQADGGAGKRPKVQQQQRRRPEKEAIGKEFRAKKARGDVKKRADQPDPYAYVPLSQVGGKKAKRGGGGGGNGAEMSITGKTKRR
ncbi:unnamed protein product [Parajaminaea phylloscopi]